MTITTCHEQFERKGDPWLTERERKELQASLSPARGGRKMAVPKPVWVDPPVKKRGETQYDRERKAMHQRVDLIAQLTGCKPRQLKPIGPKGLKALVTHIPGPQREELSWDREEILAEAERKERQWKQWLAQERAGLKR